MSKEKFIIYKDSKLGKDQYGWINDEKGLFWKIEQTEFDENNKYLLELIEKFNNGITSNC